jgi:phage tail sheath protein FI
MNLILANRQEVKYSRPGVYLENDFHQPRRDPFTTGVPVFVGLCRGAYKEKEQDKNKKKHQHEKQEKPKGSRLVPLALWSHFVDHVGKLDQECCLAYAVRGFFQNGGRRCYVIVVDDTEPATILCALDEAAKFRSIDLVCVTDLGVRPKDALELQKMILAHCDATGDRFAIFDSRREATPEKAAQDWSDLHGTNGALYYPWIHVRKFEGGDSVEDKILVPPCGHVAGLYARTDQHRGVHKSPANDLLEGVLSLERTVTYARHREQAIPREQAVEKGISPVGRVNCIRSFPGRGIRVWGARTVSGIDAWAYVSVRRLFLTVIRWLEWHMTEVVFEPNDPRLWARIENELHQYFQDLYMQGALQGPSPAEAYYVKCDESNNPRESIEQGKVVAEIGLAASIPFEFVVVRLIYGASGVSINGPIRPEQNS